MSLPIPGSYVYPLGRLEKYEPVNGQAFGVFDQGNLLVAAHILDAQETTAVCNHAAASRSHEVSA